MSFNNMIKESEEYLFEIKISNFKIVLGQLVEYIGKLNVDEDDEDDKNNLISLGVELVKQYEIITNKIASFTEDIVNITTTKLNLESKITKLNEYLNDANSDINNIQELYTKEKQVHDLDLKKLKEVSIKLKKTDELIGELENLIEEKRDEILYYKNKFEEIKKNKIKNQVINDEIYQPTEKQTSYIQKMNESNNKLLQQKSDKIKSLEKDLKDMFDKVSDLQIIITKKDEYINEIENNISRLNKDYIDKINNISILNKEYIEKINNSKCTSLDSEIIIEKYKEDITILNKENDNLKLEISKLKIQKNMNELEKPLLDLEINDDVNKCSLCNIM